VDALTPLYREEKARERSLSKFAKAQEEYFPVKILIRIRPFFTREELEEERKKLGFIAFGNLICVPGRKTKYEIFKFR
jgi:hypothetical protein